MKKKLLLLLLLALTIKSYSQENTSNENCSEIGVDITLLVKQYLNFSFDNHFYFPSPYMISYRYKFKKLGIRAGIGGGYSNLNETTNDTNEFTGKDAEFYFRTGLERRTKVSTKWQIFYGLDLFTHFKSIREGNNYSSGGNHFGYALNSKSYGISPLFGARWDLKERISISTEMSYSLYYMYHKNETLNTTLSTTVSKNVYKGWMTGFIPPTSLIVTFDLCKKK